MLRRNVKTTKPNNKLNHVKIGPFKILKSIKGVSFKLGLPNIIRIHPIFHALLLKPADNATPTAIIKPGYIDSQEEWEVEEVLNEQKINGQPYYLIKWKGFNHSKNTWEPTRNLEYT